MADAVQAPITQDVLTLPRKAAEDGGRVNLVGLTREGLREALVAIGTPERQARMRAGQMWQWVYQKGVRDFDAMTNLAKVYRATLAAHFVVEVPQVVRREVSVDGTRKYLLRIAGGHEVEAVYIPEEGRGTLCVSSQVGCTLTCSFCHTGTQRLVRNLSAGEIVGQIMVARDDLGEWVAPGVGSDAAPRLLSNIVLMGMGEPLYNFDNVRDAMRIAMDGEGISLSRRRITLEHVRRGARDRALCRGDRLPAGGIVPRDHGRCARPAGADQQALEHRGAAGCVADLSQCQQFRADHVRIRDAEGRERQRRRRAAAGEADRGHPGQDQPDPLQRMAGRAL